MHSNSLWGDIALEAERVMAESPFTRPCDGLIVAGMNDHAARKGCRVPSANNLTLSTLDAGMCRTSNVKEEQAGNLLRAT